MNLLEYLRKSFLDEIGFSKEAFIIDDPYGVPMGGSGLCARPSDMLKEKHIQSRVIHMARVALLRKCRDMDIRYG